MSPQAHDKWYVTIPAESHPLVGRGAGPFESERQARDWLLCLPVIKGAHVWRSPGSDRRAAPRRQPAAGTICHITGDEEACLVWNLSEGGAGVIVHERLPTGTTVTGNLVSPATGVTTPITGRVRHAAPVGSGCYFVGCQFDLPLPAAATDSHGGGTP
jgi:hypothetical protein